MPLRASTCLGQDEDEMAGAGPGAVVRQPDMELSFFSDFAGCSSSVSRIPYTWIYIYVYTCIYKYIYICIYVLYIHNIYIYIHMYTYTYTHIYIYIYTHIYIYIYICELQPQGTTSQRIFLGIGLEVSLCVGIIYVCIYIIWVYPCVYVYGIYIIYIYIWYICVYHFLHYWSSWNTIGALENISE